MKTQLEIAREKYLKLRKIRNELHKNWRILIQELNDQHEAMSKTLLFQVGDLIKVHTGRHMDLRGTVVAYRSVVVGTLIVETDEGEYFTVNEGYVKLV